MKCPTCSKNTKVLETRGDKRRRRCNEGHSFWTQERPVEQAPSIARTKPTERPFLTAGAGL